MNKRPIKGLPTVFMEGGEYLVMLPSGHIIPGALSTNITCDVASGTSCTVKMLVNVAANREEAEKLRPSEATPHVSRISTKPEGQNVLSLRLSLLQRGIEIINRRQMKFK